MNLIIVPGLVSERRRFSSLLQHFSTDFNTLIFPADYDQDTDQVVKQLDSFLAQHDIDETCFLAYSYGAVVVNLFHETTDVSLRRTVEMGPPNQGSRILQLVRRLPFVEQQLGRACRDLHTLQSEFRVPPRTGVIAGTKPFDWRRPEAYFLAPFAYRADSDGKVFVQETKDANMQDFTTVDEYHTYLVSNTEAIEKAEAFLKQGAFNARPD